MAAKQILSLVVASIWVVNLLSDNLKRAEEKSSALFCRVIGQKVCVTNPNKLENL